MGGWVNGLCGFVSAMRAKPTALHVRGTFVMSGTFVMFGTFVIKK